MPERSDIRNVAIIAHVDHGKTTLVDAVLRQTGVFAEHEALTDRVMDSMDQERERGITILAKNAAVVYRPATARVKINLVDTPGHADFGGEVERGLTMVDGVMLLVDASEGPLPQTRFVLRKALEARLPVVLCVNKVDRPDARVGEVLDEIYELFLDLDADEEQIEFPIVYTNAKAGWASNDPEVEGSDLRPLLDLLVSRVPAPVYEEGHPLQARVTNLDADSYVGRLALCRVHQGSITRGQQVAWCRRDGTIETLRASELYVNSGLQRVPAEEAGPGEIIALAGIPEITIGETIADPVDPRPLPVIAVEEPALGMTVGINTSPLAGQSGTRLTSRQVADRLAQELVGNVAIRVLDTDQLGYLGGAGPRRAAAGRARRDDAPRGVRADRRQAAGGRCARWTARCTSRSSGCRSTCPRTSSAWSPRCSRCAAGGWRGWSTTAPAGSASTSSSPRAA